MENQLYSIKLMGPDGQEIQTLYAWPNGELPKGSENISGDRFYNLSDETDVNELGNQICEEVETHFNQFNVETPDTVTSERGGEVEESVPAGKNS